VANQTKRSESYHMVCGAVVGVGDRYVGTDAHFFLRSVPYLFSILPVIGSNTVIALTLILFSVAIQGAGQSLVRYRVAHSVVLILHTRARRVGVFDRLNGSNENGT